MFSYSAYPAILLSSRTIRPYMDMSVDYPVFPFRIDSEVPLLIRQAAGKPGIAGRKGCQYQVRTTGYSSGLKYLDHPNIPKSCRIKV